MPWAKVCLRKPSNCTFSPHTMAVFITTYLARKKNGSSVKINFEYKFCTPNRCSFLKIPVWTCEITTPHNKTQSREQMASSIREETVQSCRSVHPVRRLHHSAVTVLALLISRPWLRLLAAISSLQCFLPVSEPAAPPVRAGRTEAERTRHPLRAAGREELAHLCTENFGGSVTVVLLHSGES